VAVTRWREDPTKDACGTFFYIRDLTRQKLWSPTHQPCRVAPEDASMRYFLGKVVYDRTDGGIETRTEICVSPEVDAEIRQITLVNHGAEEHLLEVTSYVEPVLSPAVDDRAHTAFNRLFIETEVAPDGQALLAHRRPRRPGDPAPWLVHSVTVDGETVGPLEYETDRSRFIGRGRSVSLPQAVQSTQRLAGTTGPVLDPILCLRCRIKLAPGKSARFWFVTGIAEQRDDALAISRQLRQPFQLDRAFELAWTRSRIVLHYLNLQPRHDNLFQWMASQLFYFNPYRPRRNSACLKNAKGQSGLWSYGISGDLPIVLVRLSNPEGLDLVSTVLRAHEYWRLKGLRVDLVILNDFQGGYEQPLQEELRRLLEASSDHDNLDRPGGVFLRSGRLMPEEDQTLLETVARISLRGEAGDLVSQLQAQPVDVALPPALPGGKRSLPLPRASVPVLSAKLAVPPADLLFFNGWGGFAPSGREYVIHLRGNDLPPAPWLNVIANPGFGFQVSEAGGGYTWSENSREHKLTPWSNDAVLDPSGEICYLRDEEEGYFWSVTPLPVREGEAYSVQHGQGYTLFTHDSHGLTQRGLVFVPPHDPVKIFRLDLSNNEARSRHLSVTYYLEWVLGVSRDETAPYIVTTRDEETGALFARQVYQESFPGRQAFLHVWSDDPTARTTVTGDRAEFVGRNGSLARPAALTRTGLSGHTGAMSDSCGAVQLKLTIGPRATRTVVVLVGSAKSVEEARKHLQTYGLLESVDEAYDQARNAWDALLDRVQVTTPDPGLDLLLNRWLLYQVLSCRLWARSALYQSGGAFGFRDQLQDALALLHARPDLVRDQILKHAAHQFGEGDVQHWWHEETGRGIRTRSSDDLLWLPYAVCRYVEHTADSSIWSESVPYLSDEPLGETEDDRYGVTGVSEAAGSVYEHCVRAVDRALRFGDHGLPLMGAGDWNDGLNAVGRKGRGESVWLGWFLFSVLQAMAPVARQRGDDRAGLYQEAADRLARALDESGWDGQWYRRAYTDEGEPLGSQHNVECQIDCIAQAWAALSQAAPPDKVRTAMESLENRLLDRDNGLIYILTPPFDETTPSPGYIEGYPPGVRENGGQYTHGAVWAAMAWAKLGEGDRAYELLRLLNPIYHARTQGEALRYRVEPYVMAADIYSAASQLGRGGWTWYTGAAGWMYQAGLEWVLGVRRRGDRLLLQPCIPADWPEYTVTYRHGESNYVLQVKNPAHRQTGATSFELDGVAMDPHEPAIFLVDDGRTHHAVLVL
jgi:cellobiose phosphorylase